MGFASNLSGDKLNFLETGFFPPLRAEVRGNWPCGEDSGRDALILDFDSCCRVPPGVCPLKRRVRGPLSGGDLRGQAARTVTSQKGKLRLGDGLIQLGSQSQLPFTSPYSHPLAVQYTCGSFYKHSGTGLQL